MKATGEQAGLVVDAIRKQSEMIVPTSVPQDAFADADDLPVLGTAVAGRADYLVTGDKQLLAMGSYVGIPIVSPRLLYNLTGGNN